MVENLVAALSIYLWSTMVDGRFSILDAVSFTFLSGLPRPSQKGERRIQYELGVAVYRTIYDHFVLNNNLWAIPSFMIDFTCLLTITRSPVSNYLTSLPLLHISLCLRLLSDNRLLNYSLCINRSGDAASKWYKACCPSELPSLDLDGDKSIGNGNYLLINTNNGAMSVLYTGPAFQAYSANNMPNNHWRRLTFYSEFIFCTLFNYLQNPSFIIFLVVASCCCMYWD